MVAILKTISKTGEVSELGTCSGVGELYWPYIRLEPTIVGSNIIGKKHSMSQLNLTPVSYLIKYFFFCFAYFAFAVFTD